MPLESNKYNSYDLLRSIDKKNEESSLISHIKMYCLVLKATWHNPQFSQTCLENIQKEALTLGDY